MKHKIIVFLSSFHFHFFWVTVGGEVNNFKCKEGFVKYYLKAISNEKKVGVKQSRVWYYYIISLKCTEHDVWFLARIFKGLKIIYCLSPIRL